MGKIYKGVTELVGKTPLLEVSNIEKELQLKAKILVKLEYFNPAGSVKDRVALNMVEEAEREGKIKPDDCKGATFTISNMGMFDVFTFNPIINQPESGILGITGIEDVLKMRDGNVVVRQEAVLCMSYDHRVMDGVGSAQLKKRVKELIEHPIDILV